MSHAAVEHKMRDLDQAISRIEKKIGYTRKKPLPTTLIVAVATPIVVLVVLYVAQPKFILADTELEPVRDPAKLAKWTVGFTVAIYAALYGAYWAMTRRAAKKAGAAGAAPPVLAEEGVDE